MHRLRFPPSLPGDVPAHQAGPCQADKHGLFVEFSAGDCAKLCTRGSSFKPHTRPPPGRTIIIHFCDPRFTDEDAETPASIGTWSCRHYLAKLGFKLCSDSQDTALPSEISQFRCREDTSSCGKIIPRPGRIGYRKLHGRAREGLEGTCGALSIP